MRYICVLIVIFFSVSCKNNTKNSNSDLKETDSFERTTPAVDEKLNQEKGTVLKGYEEQATAQNAGKHTINNTETENTKRPDKSIIRNLEIDTTNAFGVWTLDPDGPHADFLFNKDSFYEVDYDGDGAMPYILDTNEIVIFYGGFTKKGIINATDKDTLKIRWEDYEAETIYVKFKQ